MKLYEEILLLKHYFAEGGGKYCVENVRAYYDPLIKPLEMQRHYFWVNFHISERDFAKDTINLTGGRNEDAEVQIKRLQDRHGFDLSSYEIDKRTALRNCVTPELGLHILNESKRIIQPELFNPTQVR